MSSFSSTSPTTPVTRGKSGTTITTRKPLILAAVDGHMHIQSGHVGTIPFVLGKIVPFSLREKSLDIPFKEISAVLKREYLDKDIVNAYEKKYQPFMHDLAGKTDVLAGKVKGAAGEITRAKKRIQELIFKNSRNLCLLIQKVFSNYENSLDADQKAVVDIMADNMRSIGSYIERGELITAVTKTMAIEDRQNVHTVSAALQQKADMLTGVCISIATYIVDFQLVLTTGVCDAGTIVLKNLKSELQMVVDNVVSLFEQITSIKKVSARVICWDLFQIIMESARSVADFSSRNFSKAEGTAAALHSQLTGLSELLDQMMTSGIGQLLLVQKEKSYSIAAKAVTGNTQSLIALANKAGAANECIFAPMIALSMDLDFSHLDRFNADFEKAKVYQYAKVRYWWNRKIMVHVAAGEVAPGIDRVLLEPETPAEEIQQLRRNDTVDVEHGDFYYFHSRLSGVKPGKLFWVHPSEFGVYEYWKIQRRHTIKSANNNPWRIVPLYHFEPRRYSGDCDEAFQYVMDKNSTSCSGKEPRVFIGIKVYPNLGYKPLDPRLKSLETLYKKCCDNDIPVMTHGGPNGAFTHDRPLYHEYDALNNIPVTVPLPDLDTLKHIDKETYYFMQEYASPHAWEQVLKKYPSLRLCIAHFGGSDDRPDSTDQATRPLSGWNVPINPEMAANKEWNTRYWNQKIIAMMQTYENLYTDLSCYEMFKNAIIQNLSNAIIGWPDLRKRILFGTDWYMTEMSSITYEEFVEQMKTAIDEIDATVRKSLPENDPPLWQWMTEINPFRFYRFDRIAKEYTKEIVRSIEGDEDIKDINKPTKINFAGKQETLIYAIAKKLQKIGELPDAVTSD